MDGLTHQGNADIIANLQAVAFDNMRRELQCQIEWLWIINPYDNRG